MSVGVGVLGLGSVFWGPYMSLLERLGHTGEAHVEAVYDLNPDKRLAAATRLGLDPSLTGPRR